MARARNIKPGFFKNEDLAECTLAARLCFAGLWTLADREGRLEDRPKRIKGELFAFDAFAVEPLLDELAEHRFIQRYEVDGQRVIQVSKFSEHQTPHYSEKPSVIKPPKFQESPPDDEQIKPGTLLEDSEKSVVIKRGSQPPDSLNPDSLNPSPSAKKARKRATSPPQCPESVAEQVWVDWLALRAKKRAPVTATVLDSAVSEAGKAGMSLESFLRVWCARGSQGLQADWLKPNERMSSSNGHPVETPPSRDVERTQQYLREHFREFTPEEKAAADEARKRAMAHLGRTA